MIKQIERARKSKGLTQKQVADMAGITQQFYNKFVHGNHDIKFGTIGQLCDALDLSLDEVYKSWKREFNKDKVA